MSFNCVKNCVCNERESSVLRRLKNFSRRVFVNGFLNCQIKRFVRLGERIEKEDDDDDDSYCNNGVR